MKGYLDNPDATRNTLSPENWLHTGDVAYYDKHHQFFIVDRLKELIKVGGFQVANYFKARPDYTVIQLLLLHPIGSCKKSEKFNFFKGTIKRS